MSLKKDIVKCYKGNDNIGRGLPLRCEQGGGAFFRTFFSAENDFLLGIQKEKTFSAEISNFHQHWGKFSPENIYEKSTPAHPGGG
jgi:hypothetical protein